MRRLKRLQRIGRPRGSREALSWAQTSVGRIWSRITSGMTTFRPIQFSLAGAASQSRTIDWGCWRALFRAVCCRRTNALSSGAISVIEWGTSPTEALRHNGRDATGLTRMSRQRQFSGVPTSKACGRSCIEFLLEVDRRPGDVGRAPAYARFFGDSGFGGEVEAVNAASPGSGSVNTAATSRRPKPLQHCSLSLPGRGLG